MDANARAADARAQNCLAGWVIAGGRRARIREGAEGVPVSRGDLRHRQHVAGWGQLPNATLVHARSRRSAASMCSDLGGQFSAKGCGLAYSRKGSTGPARKPTPVPAAFATAGAMPMPGASQQHAGDQAKELPCSLCTRDWSPGCFHASRANASGQA